MSLWGVAQTLLEVLHGKQFTHSITLLKFEKFQILIDIVSRFSDKGFWTCTCFSEL